MSIYQLGATFNPARRTGLKHEIAHIHTNSLGLLKDPQPGARPALPAPYVATSGPTTVRPLYNRPTRGCTPPFILSSTCHGWLCEVSVVAHSIFGPFCGNGTLHLLSTSQYEHISCSYALTIEALSSGLCNLEHLVHFSEQRPSTPKEQFVITIFESRWVTD